MASTHTVALCCALKLRKIHSSSSSSHGRRLIERNRREKKNQLHIQDLTTHLFSVALPNKRCTNTAEHCLVVKTQVSLCVFIFWFGSALRRADSDLGGCSLYPAKPVSSYRAGNVTPLSVIVFAFTSGGGTRANGDMSISTKTASLSTADRRRLPGSTGVFTMKIKWDVYTISAEGEKQVCDNMNKIWELLMICILMTHHHANQFILWPQIADWCRAMRVRGNALRELRKKKKKRSEDCTEITRRLK